MHLAEEIAPQWPSLSFNQPVLNSYLQDEHYQELLQRLAVTPDTTGTFTLTAGILRYKSIIYIGADKDLQNQLLGSFHASAIGGHSGMVATYQRIKRLFYWPGLKKDTQHYIIECAVCQRAKQNIAHTLVYLSH
jgi:hypothetical protein